MLTIMLELEGQEAVELVFEHSLVSLSKWESKYEKAFFGKAEKTLDETMDYLSMMLLTKNSPEDYVSQLNNEQIMAIGEYINSVQTATTFREQKNQRGGQEHFTSELIYYWLVQFQIPFDPVETWHLNRLMTLVKICGIKQTKPKKMSPQEIAAQNRELNEQRRKEMGTSG